MALARDASATGTETGASSLTFALTCDPTVQIVYIAFYTTGTVTGVTYNSVAATSIDTSAVGNALYVYALKTSLPTDGLAHNVVISLSGVADTSGVAVSYKGSGNSIQFGAHTNNAGTATPLTTTITDTYANSWTILAARNNTAGTTTAGTGSNLVIDSNGIQFYDSNGPVAKGSESMSVTFTNGNSVKTVMAETGILQVLSTSLAVGSFSLTGFAVTMLKIVGTLTAAVGTFILSGIAATFLNIPWGPSESKNKATFTGETKE